MQFVGPINFVSLTLLEQKLCCLIYVLMKIACSMTNIISIALITFEKNCVQHIDC